MILGGSMKIIVIYKSKTGFTKRYAQWIAEELKCDMVSYEKVSAASIAEYDCVIYGGGIYAGKIGGLKKIKPLLANKPKTKFIVFATGATPSAAEEVINTTWKVNFTEEELEEVPHFYMQSGLSYEKMGFFDRLMMKAFSKMLSKKEDKSTEEVGTQLAIIRSHDISSKEFIEPIVKFVRLQR